MRLWQRWVAANAISEMVGLGLTFALIGAITPRLDRLVVRSPSSRPLLSRSWRG